MQKIIILLAILFIYTNSLGQRFNAVVFDELPIDLQLYPRNNQNKAVIPISGRIEASGWAYLSVVFNRNQKPYSYQRAPIVYNAKGDVGTFTLSPTIVSELAEYGVDVYASQTGRDSILIVSRKNLVAGDSYIIFGQSNARAWEEVDSYKNEYCRTFGVQTTSGDFEWGYSNENYTGYKTDEQIVGEWGISFQKYIMETVGIPTCIITQADPGQAISALTERNPLNHADIQTQYGRLLTYVTKAKLINSVKALFYWQGETEASHVPSDWKPIFDRLYHQLEEDYPSLQRYYVFQLPLFGGNAYNEEVGVMRDYQRQLGDIYPKITSFAPLGATGWNGFHYKTEGYRQVGTELAKIVLGDFYQKRKYLCPNIRKAYYSSEKRDEVILAFEEGQQMEYPKDTLLTNFILNTTGVLSVKDFFFLNGRWKKVESGKAVDNTIVLKLKEPASLSDTLIKYLPSVYPYSGNYDYQADEPWVYLGPFLKNSDGFRAFAFHNVKLGKPMAMPILSTSDVTYGQAKVSWTLVPTATKYLLERKKQGATIFEKISETANLTYVDRNLEDNQTYVYRLRAVNNESEISNTITVKTPLALATTAEIAVEKVKIYPNPVTNRQLNLLFDTAMTGMLSLIDFYGVSLIEYPLLRESQVVLSLPDLETGVYFVRISSGTNVYTQKIVVATSK